MLSYYPQSFNIPRIAAEHPDLEIVNDDEEERLQDVMDRRKRGKGPPKKAKTEGHCLHLSSARILITFFHSSGQPSVGQEALMIITTPFPHPCFGE